MRRILYALTLLLFFSQLVSGQYIANINPANISDPRVVFANPGGIGYNEPYVVAGYQNLYAGLSSELSHSAAAFIYPTARLGSFAITGQNFQAPLFSRSAFEARYAYFFDQFRTTIGVNLGFLTTSYNRGRFQVVDDGDPLLSGDLGLNTFNMGFGFTSEVIDDLVLGFSVDHLNRPSVSLEDDYRKDTHLRAGLMYTVANFRPLALWEFDENEHYLSFGAEYWFDQIMNQNINVMARGFISQEQFSLGAGLVYKNIRLDYLFDYPLNDLSAIAGGTHQFVAAYSLGELRGCPPPTSICVVTNKVFQAQVKKNVPVIDPANSDFKTLPNEFELNGQRYEILNAKSASSFVISDSVCTFDVSHSQVQCGWKEWLLGIYVVNDNGGEKVVWHAAGKGHPGGPIRWVWPKTLKTMSDFNRTFYCRLRIVDKKGQVAISPPDQFYIEYKPSAVPRRYVLLYPSVDQNAVLDAQSKNQLNAIADLDITGVLEIEQVIGYTDSTGTAWANQTLSQKQAEAVHNYLTSRGAAINRGPVGFGENDMFTLLPNDTPQGRRMNRRVEIVVRPVKN